ncbi:hypothetical protein [Variovorax rhizosphaerae]|uniref:Uncharacterized protein n=1 Tax=Variovorax rhizosphaerae TaxID=1836200 RepID=A0ABU8WZ09_9BURK
MSNSSEPGPRSLALEQLFADDELIRRGNAVVRAAQERGLTLDKIRAEANAAWPSINAELLAERAAALPEMLEWAGLNNDELACLARWLRKPDTMPLDIETSGAIAGTLHRMRSDGYDPTRVHAFIGRVAKERRCE